MVALIRRAGHPLPDRRDLLDDRDGAASAVDAAQILEGPKARALLAG
jgi:hypothetical protein